ncbi:MAG: DUF3089 domain-containing protein [Alphaproteobacteria bacterium]
MRKILIGIVGLVLILGFGFMLFGERIILAQMTPDYDFGTQPEPQAPNYADPKSWAAWPGTNGPAERVPEGITKVAEADRKADAFFIHPTTDYTGETWLAAINKPVTNSVTDNGTMAGQAATFNKCCTIYAPRYRQITLMAYRQGDMAVTSAALDAAYKDVRAAFQHFVAQRTPGRPLILSSHSQGTQHLEQLLADEVVGKPIQQDLVAVYAVGGHTPSVPFVSGALSSIPPCEGALDTGCVLGWDAYEADGTVRQDAEWMDAEMNSLCMNPVSWTRGTAKSDKADHKGAVPPLGSISFPPRESPVPGGETPLAAPIAGHLSAWCDTGNNINGLRVSAPRDETLVLSGPVGEGGNLHILDYALFFVDVRENAAARVDAFVEGR